VLHPQISVYGRLKILSWYCWDGMDISYKNIYIYNYIMVLNFNIGEGFLKMTSHMPHLFSHEKCPSPSIVSEGDFLTLFISRGHRNAKLLLSCDCGLKQWRSQKLTVGRARCGCKPTSSRALTLT